MIQIHNELLTNQIYGILVNNKKIPWSIVIVIPMEPVKTSTSQINHNPPQKKKCIINVNYGTILALT